MESTTQTECHQSANTHNTSSITWGNKVTNFYVIPTSVCTRIQAKKITSRQPICLTDSDHDYILEEIICQKKWVWNRRRSL